MKQQEVVPQTSQKLICLFPVWRCTEIRQDVRQSRSPIVGLEIG